MDKIFGIYLAAGSSKRMGQNKLALPFRGMPLGAHGLAAAIRSKLDKINVVVNNTSNYEWAAPLLRHPKVEQVISSHSHIGQALSIRCGLNKAIKEGADGVIIQLADQPFVSSESLNKLLGEPKKCDYVGFNVRPPILIWKSLFSELLKLEGDIGARHLLKQGHIQGRHLEWSDKRAFLDVDTLDTYKRLTR